MKKKKNEKVGEKISIELTKVQFFALLRAVYLGNWMANAQRDGSPEDPHKKEYSEIESLIFSFAKKFGFSEYVDDENANEGIFCPTRIFEDKTDVHDLHEEYNEGTFWDELIDSLGRRDFYRRYSISEIGKMTEDEWFEKLYECIDQWADEIDERGIEKLKIEDK